MVPSGFPHSSVGKESACNAGDSGSIPESGRSPGEGNGNPPQYSCLENPMDGGAWQATVHGVARVGHDLATLLTMTTNMVPTSGKVCDLQSGLPEIHLDFSWSQDSCSTKTFCFAATKSKRTSDWELRGWGSALASLPGPLSPLTTGTSVLEPLNFPKALSSCHLVGPLHSSPGECHHCLEDEENKALALSCPQLQQTEAE